MPETALKSFLHAAEVFCVLFCVKSAPGNRICCRDFLRHRELCAHRVKAIFRMCTRMKRRGAVGAIGIKACIRAKRRAAAEAVVPVTGMYFREIKIVWNPGTVENIV